MSLNMRNEKWGFALDLPFRLTWYFTSSILFRRGLSVSVGASWRVVKWLLIGRWQLFH